MQCHRPPTVWRRGKRARRSTVMTRRVVLAISTAAHLTYEEHTDLSLFLRPGACRGAEAVDLGVGGLQLER